MGLRSVWPVCTRASFVDRACWRIKVRSTGIHGVGVFATRRIAAGEVIARYRGRLVDRHGTYVSSHTDATGQVRDHEIVGPLKYLNHSCRPNAELNDFRLTALVPIRVGQEITMSYGDDACDCDKS